MKSLIIVEDDPIILESLNMVFSHTYHIILYKTADLLIESAFTYPDLFLIDHQLSGTTGLSLCQILKTNNETRSIPVILMSASPDVQQLAKLAGADDFLEKPYSVKVLREMVRKYI